MLQYVKKKKQKRWGIVRYMLVDGAGRPLACDHLSVLKYRNCFILNIFVQASPFHRWQVGIFMTLIYVWYNILQHDTNFYCHGNGWYNCNDEAIRGGKGIFGTIFYPDHAPCSLLYFRGNIPLFPYFPALWSLNAKLVV